MVGDIGQPTHLHYDMFCFILPDYFLYVYASYYTIVAYAICDMITWF